MMNIQELQKEYTSYYEKRYLCNWKREESPLWAVMDREAAAHPGWTALEKKAMQYEVIADNFTPVLFPHSPFFFEMGHRWAEHRGTPDAGLPSSWMTRRHLDQAFDPCPAEVNEYCCCNKYGIHLVFNFWDSHHHSTNSTNIIRYGMEHFCQLAEKELEKDLPENERIFLECSIRGMKAYRKIAWKFAEAAEKRAQTATDPLEKKFMSMIAQAGKNVPWKPAASFYEALAVFPFLYEVTGGMEGNGLSAYGRPDYLLGPLYERDLAAGKITPEEAYDLIGRMLCFTECRYNKYGDWSTAYNSQENGTAMSLGGYDENGKTVFNEVTMMLLRAHRELNLIFPKIEARLTKDTPQEFLTELNRNYLMSRNVIALQNDETVIPAHVKAGKTFADASHYTIGACWEIIVEGYEHSAGANCYFNLLKILDCSIHHDPELEKGTGTICKKLDLCQSFEEVYRVYYSNVIREIRRMCRMIHDYGRLWPQVNPSPAYSGTMFDCIANHKDYTAGGGRYNPHGLPLAGFANTIDALLVIKRLCFTDGVTTLAELLNAVRNEWKDAETLRLQAQNLNSFFGDNKEESNALAKRLFDDIYRDTRDLKNEREGEFQLAFYSAWEYLSWADKVRATPDGRRKGDVIANGITPTRTHKHMNLTDVLQSVAAMDMTCAPANSSLDVTLPMTGLTDDILSALERSFVAIGGMQMQLNCLSAETLKDAQLHPENHRDLFVRIFGFSARFVLMPEKWQNEIISRYSYKI